MKQLADIFGVIWNALPVNGRRAFALAIVLFLAMVALRVGTPFAFAYLIEVLQRPAAGDVVWLVLAYGLIFFFVRMLEELRFAVYVFFEQLFQKELSLRILMLFYVMSPESEKRASASETAIIVDRGLGGLRNVMYNLVFSISPLLFETIALILVLGYKVSVSMAALVLGLLSAFVFITYRMTSRISQLQQIWYETSSRNFRLLTENLRSHETLRTHGATEWATRRYGSAADRFIDQVLRSLRPSVALGFLQGIIFAVMVTVICFSVLRAHGSLSSAIPTLVLVNALVLQIVAPLVQFAAAYRIFIQGLASSKQLTDLVAIGGSGELVAHDLVAGATHAITTDKLRIRVSKVKQIVLEKVCVGKRGLSVIVGRSGLGKSTLGRTLAGLQPYDGVVSVDEDSMPVRYVGQIVDVFDLSMADNVSLGVLPGKVSVDEALQQAGFDRTEIDEVGDRRLGDEGVGISGGQRCRIGIARLIYHGAGTAIFDEPTASLDSAAVESVVQSLVRLSENTTVIVITHDSNVVARADQVIDLSRTVVAEEPAKTLSVA